MPKTSKCDIDLYQIYTEVGFTLFPCIKHTKKPQTAGFLQLKHNPYIRFKDQNQGVLLKNEYVVIDVDTKNYKEGEKPLSDLFEFLKLGKPSDLMKKTFVARTPSGGYHIYLRKHPKLHFINDHKTYMGLEFKTGFIMACGSYSSEKEKPYAVHYHDPSNIIMCPDALQAFLEKKMQIVDIEEKQNNHPVDVNKFIRYCCIDAPFSVAKENGNNTTYKVAARGKNLGLTTDVTFDCMAKHYNQRCKPAWTMIELEQIIKNAYQYGDQLAGITSIENEFETVEEEDVTKLFWDENKSGSYKTTPHNTRNYIDLLDTLELKGRLKFNEFSQEIELLSPPDWLKTKTWEEYAAIAIQGKLSSKVLYNIAVPAVHNAILLLAKEHSYHPVKDYLGGLNWDGLPRLDTWLHMYCGAEENAKNTFIGRKTLIAGVARIYEPGCKFDHVLVMEGRQGVGKSYTFDILSQPWFTDAPLDIRDKGAVEVLQGKWFVELAEMDAIGKFEKRTLKGFLSRREDRCRMAYERSAKSFPRQNIFVGTINPEASGWLVDNENRRFWPVATPQFNLKTLQADRDQLWAEAYHYYREGENIHVSDTKMETLLRDEVSIRQLDDPWTHKIVSWIEEHAANFIDSKNRCLVVDPIVVYEQCINGSALTFSNREALRITTILKKMGFVKRRIRVKGKRENAFTLPIDKML